MGHENLIRMHVIHISSPLSLIYMWTQCLSLKKKHRTPAIMRAAVDESISISGKSEVRWGKVFILAFTDESPDLWQQQA